jgi:hypothetical protein
MKLFGKTLLTVLVLLSVLFITCDMTGLGPGVNTNKPEFGTGGGGGGTQPGGFIRGSDPIRMKIPHAYAPDFIESAYMTVDYIDIDGNPQTAYVQGVKDDEIDWWLFNLDSNNPVDQNGDSLPPMGDGTITTQIFAKDKDGVTTNTTPLVYTIKNKPPQLEMSMPKKAGVDFDSDVASDKINQSVSLIAIATDLLGIAQGYPQIMMWPKSAPKADPNDPDVEWVGDLDPDNAPASNARQWGTWRTMLDDKGQVLNINNLKAVMAYWPTVKLRLDGGQWVLPAPGTELVFPTDYLDVGDYHYKIRVKDNFEGSAFNIYPYRLDNEIDNGSPATPDTSRKMTVTITSSSNPIISFADVPRYYNHNGNFIADVTITGVNPVSRVEGIVNNSSAVDFDASGINKFELTLVPSTNNRYRITVPSASIAAPPDGKSSEDYSVHIRATDNQGNWSIANRHFIFDIEKPEVQILEPVNLGSALTDTELTSTVKFRGTTEDDQRVVALYYAIGRNEIDDVTKEKDGSTTNHHGWLNTGLGSGHEYEPHRDLDIKWSGSLSSWTWEFTNIAQVCTAAPPANPLNPHARNASAVTFNHYVYNGGQGNQNIWVLPIQFKVIDIAGNVNYVERLVKVDPDGDRPSVEITSHGLLDNTIDIVGGTVRLSGIARDNEVVTDVLIKVVAETDANIAANKSHGENYANYSFSNVITPNAHTRPELANFMSVKSLPEAFGEGNIVGAGGSVVSWFCNINRNSILQPPANELRHVKVELRARDASIYSPDVSKPERDNEIITTLILKFSGDIPRIENITIIPNTFTTMVGGDSYNVGAIVSGDFVIRANLSAKSGVKNIRVRKAGGFEEWLEIPNPPTISNPNITPWSVAGGGTVEGYRESYTLYIPIRSNLESGNGSIAGGSYANLAGTYNLDIQVYDNTQPTPYMAQETVSLQIDNFAPLGSYTGNRYAVGTYSIRGQAWDTGRNVNVQGVDRVVVFLTRNDGTNGFGAPASIYTGAAISNPTSNGWINNFLAFQGRSQDSEQNTTPGAMSTLAFYPNTNIPASGFSEHGMVITPSTQAHTYNSIRYTPSFAGNPIVNWSVTFDSRNIQDGRYWVNYVVFDHAGNRSYFREDVYFANNAPKITRIHLGTDVNRDGNVTTTNPNEFKAFTLGDLTELITTFRARNNRFAVRTEVAAGTGNGNLNYSVNYAVRSASQPIGNGTGGTAALVAGNVYTIEQQGDFDWINYGALAEAGIYEGVTFVASRAYSGATLNNTRVYSYTTAGNTTVTQAATADRTSGTLMFNSTHFPGLIADNSSAYFLVRVHDTTIGGGAAQNQLSNVIPVTVNIQNTDNIPAQLKVSHFGQEFVLKAPAEGSPPRDIQNPDDWEEQAIMDEFYNRNIVMTNSDNNIVKGITTSGGNRIVNTNAVNRTGYVQYRGAAKTGGTANTASVSGRVVFTGQASDNVAIALITAEIANYNGRSAGDTNTVTVNSVSGNVTHTITANEFVIARWDQATNQLQAVRTIANMPATPATANQAWGLDFIDNYLSTDYGHFANWEFAWDSQNVTDMARNSNAVTFRVYDFNAGNNTNGNTITADGVVTTGNQLRRYNVDIVPYITKIETPLSTALRSNPSAFDRSAQGWYPVREDAPITIRGFNFGNTGVTGTTGTTTLSIGGTAFTGVNATPAVNTSQFRIISRNEIAVNVGRTANSGAVTLSVGATTARVEAFNNRNDNNAHYNEEQNKLNNNILNDERHLYIWSTGELQGNIAGVANIFTTFFRMDHTANRLLAYGYYDGQGTGAIRVNRNGTNYTYGIANTTNRTINTTLAVNSNTGVASPTWYTAGSNITAGQATNSFNIGHSTAAGNANGTATALVATLGANTDRFKFPRIAARATNATRDNNNADRVVMSFFDASNNTIYFSYGDVGATALSNISTTAATQIVVATDSLTHNGSMYTAVGLLSNGLPVMAWYDRLNQNLIFSYAGAANARPLNGTALTTANNNATSRVATQQSEWQGNAVVVDTFKGAHVDLAVDAANNVHLAYYDVGNGGLYYAFIPALNPAAINARPDTANIQKVKVDTYLSAGTKIMINVRTETHGGVTRYVPYISYAHASFAETRNSIRIAWRTNFTTPATVPAGTDINDRFTGDWEVMTVPVGGVNTGNQVIPDIEHFVCNGVSTARTGWNAAMATTGNLLRGYYVGGTAAGNNRINNTVMVTYMTDRWYEGAVLKHNLWTAPGN